jgi:hypothetical protein
MQATIQQIINIKKLEALEKYIAIQATDKEVWFVPETITENLLQRHLRQIAYLIEEASVDQIYEAIGNYRKYLEEDALK